MSGIWNFNKHRGTLRFKGRVIEVNADKHTVSILEDEGRHFVDVPIVRGSGYELPDVGEYVAIGGYGSDGEFYMTAKLPQRTITPGGAGATTGEGGKQVLVEKGKDPSRAEKLYVGHEFTKEVQGKDFRGSSREQRHAIRAGDKVIFDSAGGAHMFVNKTGDVSLIAATELQEHWVKMFAQRKSFFRRCEIGWPGGWVKAGDYKQDALENEEEDVEFSLFTTAMDKKRTRWDVEFGSNVSGATKNGDDKDIVFSFTKYVGAGSGNPPEEKKRYLRRERSNGSFEETWFEPDGSKKRLKVKVDTEKDKKVEIHVYDADTEKASLKIDLKTGKVEGASKDEVKISSDKDMKVATKTSLVVDASSTMRVNAGTIYWN